MGLSRWPPGGGSRSIPGVTDVLIVDDDPRFRVAAARIVCAAGLSVAGEVSDGAQALSAAESLRPAAALVDIGLPDIDGFEVARRLTAGPGAPRVLLTSSDAGPFPARIVAACGAVGFVAKTELQACNLRDYLES
jgi:DNA-binding NarL/FixJ family response regulator